MHHSYLDKYARLDSPLHHRDARLKLCLVLAYVVLISITSDPQPLFVFTLILLVVLLCLLAKIRLDFLLTRSFVILPFSGFAALSLALTASGGEIYGSWGPFTLTSLGLYRASSLLLRSWLAVCLVIILINTTPFDRLLRALRFFKVPDLFVLLLSFLYRYLYLFWDEIERLQRARNLRYFGGRLNHQVALLGRLSAALFLRSYQRAQGVYDAMVVRGWDGEVRFLPESPLQKSDYLTLGFGTLLFIGLGFLQWH